jgi:hypothetical protein
MFARRYFATRYFAPRYFPQSLGTAPAVVTPTRTGTLTWGTDSDGLTWGGNSGGALTWG